MHHLLLQESILVHLGNVLAGVNFEMTCLRQWHDQASAKAAAGEHRHHAEVQQEGASRVHLLRAADARVAELGAGAILRSLHLGQKEWLLLSEVRWLRIIVLNGILDVPDAILHLSDHGLGKICHLLLHFALDLVELVPELLLNRGHVAPGIHPISLDICKLGIELLLLLFVTLYILLEVGLLWRLDDNSGYILRSSHLSDGHVLLESLLDDL